jgi:hypothetical protein
MLDSVLQKRYLHKVQIQLMVRKRWAYLRYIQIREGLIEALKTAGEINSFLSVGCGSGLTEVALALEFPEIKFHLTDIDTNTQIQQRLGVRMLMRSVMKCGYCQKHEFNSFLFTCVIDLRS